MMMVVAVMMAVIVAVVVVAVVVAELVYLQCFDTVGLARGSACDL